VILTLIVLRFVWRLTRQWLRKVCELHVTTRDGRLVFDGDFGPAPDEGLQWPPFRTFGGKFYTYQILLDLKVGEGFAIRTEPDP
jgi:hypothetical protein